MSQEQDREDGRGQQAERVLAARRRADTYRLLAKVFNAEATAEMLEALSRPEVAEAFAALGCSFPSELEQLQTDLGQDKLVEELACEYTRLFIGPGDHIGPYESLHRDDHPAQHWGPSTAEVKRFVEHHGFKYHDSFTGMPDHISVEFQFMAELAQAEAEAIEQGQDAQAEQANRIQSVFFTEHISRWVPAFCSKIIERAKLCFYRDFARVASSLCEQEAATFGITGTASARGRD